jgi:hypothetical protein
MAISTGPWPTTLCIGLSSDQKPTSGIQFATLFYEYDTGITYIWTGTSVQASGQVPTLSNWVEYMPAYPMNPLRDFHSN